MYWPGFILFATYKADDNCLVLICLPLLSFHKVEASYVCRAGFRPGGGACTRDGQCVGGYCNQVANRCCVRRQG